MEYKVAVAEHEEAVRACIISRPRPVCFCSATCAHLPSSTQHRWGGYTVVERPIDKSELFVAEEVFLTGTAAKVTLQRGNGTGRVGGGGCGRGGCRGSRFLRPVAKTCVETIGFDLIDHRSRGGRRRPLRGGDTGLRGVRWGSADVGSRGLHGRRYSDARSGRRKAGWNDNLRCLISGEDERAGVCLDEGIY